MPTTSKIYDHLVRIAKKRLNELKLASIEVDLSKILLWILFIAGMAAEGRPERLLFQTEIATLCSALSLDEWEKTRTVVESVVRIVYDHEIGVT